jgi:hypothetical protein
MTNYLAINETGLAVSGIWAIDSVLKEGLSLVGIPDAPTESVLVEDPQPTIGWTWDGSEWLQPDMSIDELRDSRNEKLSGTDWIVQRHSEESVKTLTDAKYAEWLAYRGALRDITTEYSPLPGGPSFPVKP